jgi:hypothetical protein
MGFSSLRFEIAKLQSETYSRTRILTDETDFHGLSFMVYQFPVQNPWRSVISVKIRVLILDFLANFTKLIVLQKCPVMESELI